MERMTIHRGLSELKLTDAKIEKLVNEIQPVGIYQKSKPVNGYVAVEDFTKDAQSKYQSIADLITRKGKIKSAIVAANAITKVKVGDTEMTIADAITEKASVVVKKKLITNLKQKLVFNVGQLNKENEKVKANLELILQATFGKDQTKVATTDIEAVSKPYLELNTVYLLDPILVQKKVDELDEAVAVFESNVDAALSEINATTFIEI